VQDFLNDLNGVQREAVVNYQGPSLVIAGAGSGKTRVLTYRIAYLLGQGINPRSVLSLTFTNKAAREMKDRIGQLVGNEVARSLWMGTFHSIFARILRSEADKLGYPSTFTIYDTADSRSVIKQIVKDLKLDEKEYKVAEVHSRISSAKNNLITAPAYANDPRIGERDRQSKKPRIGEIYQHYVSRCFKAGAMDFDDLLVNTNILFRDFPEVLAKYQRIFKFILVDEYQDTNFAQYLIVKKLAQPHQNVCVVGDDAQSIYSFRGAKIENILNFRNDYPDYKIFKLEQNYRSTRVIVDAANSLIAKNSNQIQKKVFSENEIGEKIKIIHAVTDQEEGFKVANEMVDLIYNYKYKYLDFAVLYRTNAQSRIFEESLRKCNIPYKVYGGLSFYQRKEIKDVLAYLRLVVNPHDEEALKRVINYPARGIGNTSLGRMEEFANQQNISLWKIACTPGEYPLQINKGTQAKIEQFTQLIRQFSGRLATTDAHELAYALVKATGILQELQTDKSMEGLNKAQNVEELLNAIKEFTKQSPGESPLVTLDVYLENVALLTDADNDKPEDNDKVTLMTVHSSKGLEFDVVFMVGMEEELFPSRMSSNTPHELEEERRLFYVAITRAKERLYLSNAETRYKWGDPTICRPSRFIMEIDSSYLEFPGGLPELSISSTRETGRPSPAGGINWKSSPTQRTRPQQVINPAAIDFVPDDPRSIKSGMQVEHARFGAGKVLQTEGNFPDVKATVFFPDHGQKLLILKYARLRIVRTE
jgi:DNA helicase II / ATP-dependent DNA helicase PcrA